MRGRAVGRRTLVAEGAGDAVRRVDVRRVAERQADRLRAQHRAGERRVVRDRQRDRGGPGARDPDEVEDRRQQVDVTAGRVEPDRRERDRRGGRVPEERQRERRDRVDVGRGEVPVGAQQRAVAVQFEGARVEAFEDLDAAAVERRQVGRARVEALAGGAVADQHGLGVGDLDGLQLDRPVARADVPLELHGVGQAGVPAGDAEVGDDRFGAVLLVVDVAAAAAAGRVQVGPGVETFERVAEHHADVGDEAVAVRARAGDVAVGAHEDAEGAADRGRVLEVVVTERHDRRVGALRDRARAGHDLHQVARARAEAEAGDHQALHVGRSLRRDHLVDRREADHAAAGAVVRRAGERAARADGVADVVVDVPVEDARVEVGRERVLQARALVELDVGVRGVERARGRAVGVVDREQVLRAGDVERLRRAGRDVLLHTDRQLRRDAGTLADDAGRAADQRPVTGGVDRRRVRARVGELVDLEVERARVAVDVEAADRDAGGVGRHDVEHVAVLAVVVGEGRRQGRLRRQRRRGGEHERKETHLCGPG